MSHCNITRRDRHSTVEHLRLAIAKLQAENKHLEGLLESAESSLTSIFDRIERGDEVYLDYANGTRIYIQAVPPTNERGNAGNDRGNGG